MFTGLTTQLDFGNHLIAEIVPEDHNLVNLKKILDWEKMNAIYSECYESNKGNATKNSNLVIGLFILKHLEKKPYRTIIEDVHFNTVYMHFCSVSYEELRELKKKGKKLIDHSTLIKIKIRLGQDRIDRIEKVFLQQLLDKGFIDGKYMFSDTTSLEKNILYPTEIGLLKRVIEEAEAVRQKVRYKKDMIKSELIKKANQIAKVYYSCSKKTKEILESCSKELVKIAHSALKDAEKAVKSTTKKTKDYVQTRYKKLKEVGATIIEQTERKLSGEKIKDKIVSYFEDHARSLPKGKAGKPVEFGDKLRIDMSGNGYITNHKLYKGNPAEAGMLKEAVNEHKELFGDDFKGCGCDRAYYHETRISELETEHNIILAIPHKKRRDSGIGKRKKKLYDGRAAIEAKISEGKRMCGLDKSLYKGFEGDEIWVSFTIMALNIRKVLREISKKPRLMRKFT